MEQELIDFYLKTSIYTNYEPYKNYYLTLPEDMTELANLVKDQTIHRSTLKRSYQNDTAISKEYPWYRYRSEDDILLTAPAMTAEIFRLNNQGFIKERKTEEKINITCRYVSILLASILKAKGIPTRCRAGFSKKVIEDTSAGDHWIVEYWNKEEKRWVRLDISRIHFDKRTDYNLYDIPEKRFEFAADAWLNVREKKCDINNYRRGSLKGFCMLAQALFYDFHALMNDEVSYRFFPPFISNEEKFQNLTKEDYKKLDELAVLLQNPDKNFHKLQKIFNEEKEYRIINTPLIEDSDHLEMDSYFQKYKDTF